MLKRITNSHIKEVGGVCAGISYYLESPVWAVRLAMIVLLFVFFPILFVYLLAWMFLPELDVSESEFNEKTRPKKYVVKNGVEELVEKQQSNVEDTLDKHVQGNKVDYDSLVSEVKNQGNLENTVEKEKNA